MDLMGTYAYGLVMKDLNRELSKDTKLPDFIDAIIREGGSGMENNNGFYKYERKM
jgi:3-hydroxybutyryl-CoA dehydrogenase